ncbi:MAG: response regulator [Gammaproteobacteria bacterium]|nr:response regulator [Gammaproteobacteria bacterium]
MASNSLFRARGLAAGAGTVKLSQSALKMNVLIVDDNQDLAMTLRDILKQEGYTANPEFSGEAGIRAARESRYDLALIDVVLPGVSGVETLRAVRDAQPYIHTVLMTAHGDRILAGEKDCDKVELLKKPLDIEWLTVFCRQLAGAA